MHILKKLFRKEDTNIYRIFGIKLSFNSCKRRVESRAASTIQDSLDMAPLKNAQKVIVFLVPFGIKIGGGIMSIFSLCNVSRQINKDSFCCIATYPKDYTYVINDKFYNNERVLRFEQIINNANSVQEMVLHIPEYYADDFYDNLNEKEINFLQSIPNLQINILNQNIDLMPEPQALQNLYKLTDNITQTIAHDRYATQEICDKWKIPTHLFSVNTDLTGYRKFKFEEKEKIIVLSPDKNEYKDKIVKKIETEFPDWKIITVKNMSFYQYVDLIGRAYFTITFGEGFDGYFDQPMRVGGVGFAVYNDRFFPDNSWKKLKNVYSSYDEMYDKICDDMKTLTLNKKLYLEIIQEFLKKRCVVYKKEKFLSNVKRFYKKEYDFIPNKSYINC